MKEYPFAIPVVGALIFNQQKQIFLVQSSGKFGDSWIIPGGKVSAQETMAEGLKREIREETNLALEQIHFLGVREYIKPHVHFIFLEHCAVAIEPQHVQLNEEATQWGWFGLKDALALNLAAPTRLLIEERFANAKLIIFS